MMTHQWKTIESAPKDGSWLLLCGGELADQRPGYEKRPVVARWENVDWFVSDFDDGFGIGLYYYEPTYWTNVPTLPNEVK